MLTASVREVRLVVERVLLVAGVPSSTVAASREFVVGAELLCGGALSALATEFSTLAAAANPAALRVVQRSQRLALMHGSFQSAIVLGPATLDFACALCHAEEHGAVVVTDVEQTRFLYGARVVGRRRGLDVFVAAGEPVSAAAELESWLRDERPDVARSRKIVRTLNAVEVLASSGPGAVVLLAVPRRHDAAPGPLERLAGGPEILRALMTGIRVESGTWWVLYDCATRALTPASERSRLDTGIVAAGPEGVDVDAL